MLIFISYSVFLCRDEMQNLHVILVHASTEVPINHTSLGQLNDDNADIVG